MGCCSCGAAMLNVPPLAPPPQPISGALQPSSLVGLAVDKVEPLPGDATMCGCEDGTTRRDWWLLVLGFVLGALAFYRRRR